MGFLNLFQSKPHINDLYNTTSWILLLHKWDEFTSKLEWIWLRIIDRFSCKMRSLKYIYRVKRTEMNFRKEIMMLTIFSEHESKICRYNLAISFSSKIALHLLPSWFKIWNCRCRIAILIVWVSKWLLKW